MMRAAAFWNQHFPNQSIILLDGGLATELEQRGYDISGALWSARLLQDAPESIRCLHYDYLQAGANVITTASYQASFPGFEQQGIPADTARELMKESVRLARQARERFLARHPHITYTPLIAASAGPYGAYLADGSEYMGDYLLSSQALKAFHQPRLEALLAAQPDLIAFETIPSRQEAQAIAELLAAYPKALAWVSFSCKDGRHISDGERIADCVKDIAGCRQLVAVGVNCTPPEFMESLIQEIKQATEIPIVVYPNSGEGWDAQRACWLPATSSGSLTEMAVRWKTAGARLIGGCCRTGVGDIERLRKKLLPSI